MYPTQSNPSAPMQPSSPYNHGAKVEPPPYSTVMGYDQNQGAAPYPPAGGYSGYGPPSQGPYPPAGNAPYPGGLGLGYGPPSQAPYPPGPQNQGPYPPMPGAGHNDMGRQVGFTGPVTMQPGYGQMPGPNYPNYNQGEHGGMTYQQQQQYTNQYPQQQQPGSVYVVQKPAEQENSMASDCCLWACCAAACCCLCEVLKGCITDD